CHSFSLISGTPRFLYQIFRDWNSLQALPTWTGSRSTTGTSGQEEMRPQLLWEELQPMKWDISSGYVTSGAMEDARWMTLSRTRRHKTLQTMLAPTIKASFPAAT